MTVNFNPNQSFAKRMEVGGEPAETAFKEYAEKHGYDVERYGFDRTSLKKFAVLPDFVRLTPDYVATRKKQGFLIECKGTGRGKVVSLKVRDYEPLKLWSELGPLYLFINDSHMSRVSFMPFEDIYPLIDTSSTFTLGSDGVKFYGIPKEPLEWEKK